MGHVGSIRARFNVGAGLKSGVTLADSPFLADEGEEKMNGGRKKGAPIKGCWAHK